MKANISNQAMAAILFAVLLAAIVAFALVAVASIDNNPKPPRITVWHYQGHDMLRYEYRGEVSVCHSPECRKCLQVYD